MSLRAKLDDEHGRDDNAYPECQYCRSPLSVTWADLGSQPLSNLYLTNRSKAANAETYPLHARFCRECFLVQVDNCLPPEKIFTDYPYFSSCSDTWLDHCSQYARKMIERFALTSSHLVIEIASNDGYLLQFFKSAGIRTLGIEPAANVAECAKSLGIDTEIRFFGEQTAKDMRSRGIAADHLTAKNVLAHVPDIGDFARGVSIILKKDAVFTVEFPHLLKTISGLQFDQIYHEHFSYLSLLSVSRIFSDQGLRVFDVEELDTHGGSLRVYICHEAALFEPTAAVASILKKERSASLDLPEGYTNFDQEITRVRNEFQEFVCTQQAAGKTIAGYGAAAKGNTFLNFCQADSTTLDFIADVNDAKIGRYMPGSAIPIVSPEIIEKARPAYLLLLPWNLRSEIVSQLSHVRQWGCQFVTAVAGIHIF